MNKHCYTLKVLFPIGFDIEKFNADFNTTFLEDSKTPPNIPLTDFHFCNKNEMRKLLNVMENIDGICVQSVVRRWSTQSSGGHLDHKYIWK